VKSIVVSIHIPKTAGVTLKNILTSVYGENFLWFTETNSTRFVFERLRNYDLNKIECIHSHMGYGIHKYLETLDIECKYIMFTRSIPNRLLSYFNYIMTDAVKEHYNWENRFGWEDDISFHDWLSSCRMADQDNSMTRFLSGCENLNTDPIKYKMCESDLDQARMSIGNFSFIGSVEKFDRDVRRLANKLSWSAIPTYGRSNAHPNHPTEKSIPLEDLELIHKTQYFDFRLHETIKRLTGNN